MYYLRPLSNPENELPFVDPRSAAQVLLYPSAFIRMSAPRDVDFCCIVYHLSTFQLEGQLESPKDLYQSQSIARKNLAFLGHTKVHAQELLVLLITRGRYSELANRISALWRLFYMRTNQKRLWNPSFQEAKSERYLSFSFVLTPRCALCTSCIGADRSLMH